MKRKTTATPHHHIQPPIDEDIDEILSSMENTTPQQSNNNCCTSGQCSSNTILEKQLEINHHLNNKLLDYVMGMTSQVFATAMQTMQHTQQMNEQLDEFKLVNKQKDMILEDKLNTKMREALEKSMETVGTAVGSPEIGGIISEVAEEEEEEGLHPNLQTEVSSMAHDDIMKAMEKFEHAISMLKDVSESNKRVPDELARERQDWEKKMADMYMKKPKQPNFNRIQTSFGNPDTKDEMEFQGPNNIPWPHNNSDFYPQEQKSELDKFEETSKRYEQQQQQEQNKFAQKFPLPKPAQDINSNNNGS